MYVLSVATWRRRSRPDDGLQQSDEQCLRRCYLWRRPVTSSSSSSSPAATAAAAAGWSLLLHVDADCTVLFDKWCGCLRLLGSEQSRRRRASNLPARNSNRSASAGVIVHGIWLDQSWLPNGLTWWSFNHLIWHPSESNVESLVQGLGRAIARG